MAVTYNRVELLGNIVFDIELQQLSNDRRAVNNRIAVKRRYPKDGEPDTDFFNFTAFGNQADFLARYFKKGDRIFIAGTIENNNYTDKTGNKRYDVRMIVSEVVPYKILDEKPQGNDAPQYSPAPQPSFDQLRANDDLPF